MRKLTLRKNEERRLLAGHQWIFSNELAEIPKDIPAGEVVSLYSHSKKFLGVGFFNPRSLIAFRLLSRSEEDVSREFFEARFRAALELRKKIYPDKKTNAFRLVHAESDHLSGLIVDKFDSVLSVQTFSAGMERLLPEICEALQTIFSPSAIVIRNESELRALEGLERYKRLERGALEGKVEICDDDLFYLVDAMNGHKTGFFLDQRENRKKIRALAQNADALDVFASDGGFALNACKAGARSVLAIDSSEDALARAVANAERNGFRQLETLKADAFEALEALAKEGRRFDLVTLDPPSLTKSKKNVPTALQAYRKLNRLALSLVKPGGFLATSSCSHHVDEAEFFNVVQRASLDAKREIALLEKSSQAPDHPILLSMPETKYLKFGLFAVR
ncbi:MAG: class I SAM-dependent rRNA methyltransferase [Chloroherpetonaceae bacterium]|nr:class I SAM-dependent rRNA methyltransferase [Chloroherpetonaceae bacterium]MDW8437043.1 class I SAM-dependent rRNA methyltransferase [Chloroherpetonaceae bacterium]